VIFLDGLALPFTSKNGEIEKLVKELYSLLFHALVEAATQEEERVIH